MTTSFPLRAEQTSMTGVLTAEAVRQEVAAFRRKYGTGRADEDCFPAWYLHNKHRLNPVDAIMQTADGSDGTRKGYDFGLDAFHVLTGASEPVLLLIQAKFTDGMGALSTALRDLIRALPRIGEALKAAPSTATRENRVLVALRDRLREMDEDARSKITLRFEILHLSEADDLVIRNNTQRAYDDLRQELADDTTLENWSYDIVFVPPSRMGDVIPPPMRPSSTWHPLELNAVPLQARIGERDVTMYSGIGSLADVVELYNKRRADLFAKNVRYFITTKQNEERGPAGKIKDALRLMCVPKKGIEALDPALFAFHHNGITIFARDLRRDDTGVHEIRDPYVLNGCQTVRSAYDFRYDARSSKAVDDDRWRQVRVPIRIITTQQEALIREITISNNRQNKIEPSALRANDEIQLGLEQQFERVGIFYERQKGAFNELLRSNSARAALFHNTNNRTVTIDTLGRCLGAVSAEFEYAHSPSHIFESDQIYKGVFAPTRLQSTALLVFLQNLHDVLPAILKSDLGLEQSNPKGPRKSRLLYYTMCLLVRYLAKNEMSDFVGLYGTKLLGRKESFRRDVAKHLGNRYSRIQSGLRDYLLPLESTSAEGMRDAFRRAAYNLALRDNIDVFAAFARLDAEVLSR